MLLGAGEVRAVSRFRYFFGTILVLTLGACADKADLSPLPPRADLCVHYSSFRYSAAAAAVEAMAALDAHNSNEAAFAEKCLLGDRSKSLGPR